MVRGADDAIYTRLAEKFNFVSARDFGKEVKETLPVEKIVRNSDDAERAVFVIEWEGMYQPKGAEPDYFGANGTAFAYESNNQLVTCDHVFRMMGGSDENTFQVDFDSIDMQNKILTVHSPTLNFKLPAKIVRRDLDRDVAILEFIDTPPSIRHFSGKDALIKKNEPGILIGYPNWTPGRSVNQAATTVLNLYPRSGLRRVEVATNIRKGNSGGPFVDALFRLAGIAQAGSTQTEGNDECLCVEELDNWLSS